MCNGSKLIEPTLWSWIPDWLLSFLFAHSPQGKSLLLPRNEQCSTLLNETSRVMDSEGYTNVTLWLKSHNSFPWNL